MFNGIVMHNVCKLIHMNTHLLRLLFLMISVLYAFPSLGQKVQVLDKHSGEPIENVALHTPDMKKSSTSNREGEMDISGFNNQDTLIFQHTSYEALTTTKQELLNSSGVVFLENRYILIRESIVSATRWEQNRSEIANQIVKIDPQKYTLYNPQTTADLLNRTGNVFIQKSQLGGGSPMIRGFSANALLIVVDGIRMNNAIFRSGNLQNVILVDPQTIQSAEIIFGPGTVIYGSDALGGVMDFHSLSPMLSTGDKPLFLFNVSSRYATANQEKTGHVDFTLGSKKISWVSGFTWSDFGDLRMGTKGHPEYQRSEYVLTSTAGDSVYVNPNSNIQVPTGYHQMNLLQKLRFRPNDSLNIVATLHYTTSGNIPRYDRLIQYGNNTLKYAEWYYGPQTWVMPVVSIENENVTRFYDQYNFKLSYQYYKESRHDRKLYDPWLRNRKETVHIATFTADFNKDLKENKSLYYGVEAIYNRIFSVANTKNIFSGETDSAPTRYPDGFNHYYATAFYLMYRLNLSPKLTLNFGGRYTRTGIHSLISDTTFYKFPYSHIDLDNGAFNGSAGLTYRPSSAWQFNVNLSSGFRAPNLDDVGKVFDSEPGRVIVPNKDLKPEYLYNLDGGIIYSSGNGSKIELTTFFSYLDQAMVRRPFLFNGSPTMIYDGIDSDVQALTNAGYAVVWGSGLSAQFRLPENFFLRSSLTITQGHDDEGLPLRHAAPLFGSTHLEYEFGRSRADLYIEYNGPVPFDKLALSERAKTHIYALDKDGNPYSPGWTTLNFMTHLKLPWNLVLETGIENILDLRYRPYSSGIVAPGRNFVFSLRYNIRS